MNRISVWGIGLVALISCHRSPTRKEPDSIPTVSFCELATHPELYQKKTVRTSGLYLNRPRASLFGSRDCVKRKFAWAVLDTELSERSPADVLEKLHAREHRFEGNTIVVTGYLEGPLKRFDPPIVIDGEEFEDGFGHGGLFPFQFTIRSVEAIQ